MKNIFLGLRYLVIFLLMLALNTGVASDKTSSRSTVKLSGHIPSKAVSEADLLEHLDATMPVSITFVLPLRNQRALEQLIQQIYNPADQQYYGKYLTSEEFIAGFAPTQEDYDKVIAYAKKIGLSVIATHPNRLLLNVNGPAKSIESAFNLKLNMYQQADGRKFYAPNSEPEIPLEIASLITGVVGLDNSAVWQAFYREKETSEDILSASAFPSGPKGGYGPSDIKTAYNLKGISANGSGQKIALFELATYLKSDITAYTSHFGLPAPNLTTILVDGGAGGAFVAEVALDIELALALAPHAHIYVYEGPNGGQGALDTYNRIATDNIAKQVSTSWGLGEDRASSHVLQTQNAIFQQMAAQGQTMYASAGDKGAYDDYPSTALVVNDPAAQPYVTGVGGTRLTVNANTGAYQSETVWNSGSGHAGGGGVSKVWPIPSWQGNVSTVFSKTNRNVPDVALNSNPNTGYSIFFNGKWSIFGGTSCAAPLWASFTSLVNQQRQASQMPVLGFANPSLYAIGTTASLQTVDYHDITTGNNFYYQAGPGYDNATGWGSFNGGKLFAGLTHPLTPGDNASSTFYINAGGGSRTDACTDVSWQADQFFSGGQKYRNNALPDCIGVYRTARYGNFKYNIPISNGPKYVILKFAEIMSTNVGARVFHVNINGIRVLSNLDLFKEVGFGKPLDLTFPVNVSNNNIEIEFITVVQNAQLNGIVVLSQ